MRKKRREILRIVFVCILASVPFLPGLQNEFVAWDDERIIAENPLLTRGVKDGLIPLVTTGRAELYVPVTYVVYWLEAQLWGINAVGFHSVNLAVHVANALLVYLLLRRLLPLPLPAFAAAVWWAVHPLHVETVVWATALKDLLSVLLALISLHLYMSWRRMSPEAGGKAQRRWFWGASLLAFALAGFCKPAVAAFPVILAGYDLFALRLGWRALRSSGPFFAVSAGIIAVTMAVQGAESLGVIPPGIPGRLAVAGDSLLFYLQKVAVPWNLSPIYGRTVEAVLASPWCWIRLAMAIVLCAAAMLPGWRWRLGMVIFVVGFAPVSGIVPFGYQAHSTVADHYAYLSVAGLALILGDVISRLGAGPAKRLNRAGHAAVGGLMLWTLILGMLAWHQTRIWHDSSALWTWSVEVNPDVGEGWRNLGDIAFRKGDYDQAINYYDTAITANPKDAECYNSRCCAWASKGNFDRAIEDCTRAIELKPDYYEAYNNRSNAWGAKGDFLRAVEDCTRAINIQPEASDGYHNRGVAYYQLRQYEKAWADVKSCEACGGTVSPDFLEVLRKASGHSE